MDSRGRLCVGVGAASTQGLQFIPTAEGYQDGQRHYVMTVHVGGQDQAWESTTDPEVVHSSGAVQAMSYLAQFFVGEARKCSHRWAGGVAGVTTLSFQLCAAPCTHSDDRWENCYLQ